MPLGFFVKDLFTCLRRIKDKRIPLSRGEDRRGQLPEVLYIHVARLGQKIGLFSELEGRSD